MTKKLLTTLLAGAFLVLACGGGSAQAAFGITSFSGSIRGADGQPLYQAGAHPDFTTAIALTTNSHGLEGGSVKDIDVEPPAGPGRKPDRGTEVQPDPARRRQHPELGLRRPLPG